MDLTSAVSEVTSYSTTLCPVTETETISGSVVTVTYTSTSVIPVVVPTTIEVLTTEAPVTES
jgi:hypothetical protein